MNDEQIVKYCRQIIIGNLSKQPQDFAQEIGEILSSEKVLLDHCFGIRDLMNKCIEILESKGVSLDD